MIAIADDFVVHQEVRGLTLKPMSGVAAVRTIKLPPASSVKNIVKRSDTLRTFLHKYKYHITVKSTCGTNLEDFLLYKTSRTALLIGRKRNCFEACLIYAVIFAHTFEYQTPSIHAILPCSIAIRLLVPIKILKLLYRRRRKDFVRQTLLYS